MRMLTRLLKMASLRLAFKFGSWEPSQSEWMFAAQCIQPEEKTRIGRFVFKPDAQSAMAGRLLMRKALHDSLQIPYNQISLGRTDKGKPYLTNEIEHFKFSFNVSHAGNWAVLATDSQCQVGIDVMPTEGSRANRTVDEYLEMMRKEFTDQEYKTMTLPETDEAKLTLFYRYWCLKESYVKALGIGIGFELKRIDFHLQTTNLNEGRIVTDTQVHLDGVLQTDWSFQETMIDSEHIVAVAIKAPHDTQEDYRAKSCETFKVLTYEELVAGADTLTEPDVEYWENFNNKKIKTRIKKQ